MTATARAQAGELELLTRAARADRARLERLLHPDFVEVGASGRRWGRAAIIDDLVAAPDVGDLHVADLDAHALTPDVVLVTYATRRGGATTRRSSVWVRLDGEWVVRFHQATPTPGDGPRSSTLERAGRPEA